MLNVYMTWSAAHRASLGEAGGSGTAIGAPKNEIHSGHEQKKNYKMRALLPQSTHLVR
jgi:hypothetical protein